LINKKFCLLTWPKAKRELFTATTQQATDQPLTSFVSDAAAQLMSVAEWWVNSIHPANEIRISSYKQA